LIEDDKSDPSSQPDEEEEDFLEGDYGEGGEGDVPAIQLILESITDAIDRLFSLATKVRNPSTRQIPLRVLAYKDVNEDTKINVIDEYAKLDHQHLMELFGYQGHAAKEEPHHYLVNRLSRANTFRRQQFGYWRRRRRKLQTVPAQPVASIVLTMDLVRSNMIAEMKDLAAPKVSLSRTATSKPYTASMLDPSKINVDDNKSIISVSEYAPTMRGPDNEAVEWPSPPSKLLGKKYFECPYCFTLCPSGYLERRAWRAHLLRDVRPYICTYEHCTDAERPYDTQKEWHTHENTVHRRIWRCLEHADLTFENRSAYEVHLQNQHQHQKQLQSLELMENRRIYIKLTRSTLSLLPCRISECFCVARSHCLSP
jgi:hypothetical protein